MKIEIEAETLSQALDAATAAPSIIMLDNFSPARAKAAVKRLRSCFRGKIELSGGINTGNLKRFAAARPDIISMGSLTGAAKSCDFSLRLLK